MKSSVPLSPSYTGTFIYSSLFDTSNRLIDAYTPHPSPPFLTLLPIQSLPHANRSQSEILANSRNGYITSCRGRSVIQRRARIQYHPDRPKPSEESNRRLKRYLPFTRGIHWKGSKSGGCNGGDARLQCCWARRKWGSAKDSCRFGFIVQFEFDGFAKSCEDGCTTTLCARGRGSGCRLGN